jgi:tetratricopeptide (TPR) repeat protein
MICEMKISSLLIVAFLLLGVVVKGQPTQHKIDSILSLLKIEKNTDKRVIQLLALSKLHYYTDINKAIHTAEDAMKNVTKSENDSLKIEVLKYLAWVYLGAQDYAKASKYDRLLMKVGKEHKSREAEEYAVFNLGLLYYHIGDFATSTKYLKQARYLIQKNITRHTKLLPSIKFQLAINSIGLNLLDSAKKYFIDKKVLEGFKGNEPQVAETAFHYCAADLYLELNNYDSCAYHIKLMQLAAIKWNFNALENKMLHLKAKLDYTLGKTSQAEKFALKSITISKKKHDQESIQSTSELLSQIKEKLHHYDSAFYYHTLSSIYEDSVQGPKIRNLLQLQDAEMEERELEITELKLKDQQKALTILLAGILVMVVILAIIYFFLKRTKILIRQVELQNGVITEQNLKLLDQANEMNTLINNLEQILKEKSVQLNNYGFYVSQRLRAPINRIVSLGKLGKMKPEPAEKHYISNKICEVTEELDAMSKEGQRLLDE